ncbi:MAG: cysteine--tRNA ligase, partial [Clostridia bacterium]|nr:cysteine--tRNA ligase [Clostridia bacterium]
FTQQMGNDLNTSMGVTAIFDVLKAKTNDATKLALIRDFETVLDLGLIEEAAKVAELQAAAKAAAAVTEWVITCETPGLDDAFMAEVEGLIQARADAKKAKDFAKADEIRDTLTGMGVTLKDSKGGVSWTKG